jgi:hypothetical protein
MPRILSHPFRLAPDGRIATVEQDTAQAHAEQLAVLVLTRRGERPLVPTFGITDPTFGDLDVAELEGAVETFGPAVALEEVELEFLDESTEQVTVTFTS